MRPAEAGRVHTELAVAEVSHPAKSRQDRYSQEELKRSLITKGV